MKAGDLVDRVVEILGEDLENNPLWSKTGLVRDLASVMDMFSELTQIVDRCRVGYVDGITGEMVTPADFGQAYFVQFNQDFLDIVDLNETEFLESTWPKDTQGSPKGVNIWGQAGRGRVRFIPVPSSVEADPGGGEVESIIYLDDAMGTTWAVTVSLGVLETSIAAGTAASYVIKGYGSYWNLGVNTDGVLTLTASSSSTASNLVLADQGDAGKSWAISAGVGGPLVTEYPSWTYGVCTGVLVDSVLQSFDQDYGIIVDVYAQGVTSSPDHVAKLEGDYGVGILSGGYENQGTLWYKGMLNKVYNEYTELNIHDGFVPVLEHGLLARAWGKDGDGQDLQKSQLMASVFLSECEAIKKTFGKRW